MDFNRYYKILLSNFQFGFWDKNIEREKKKKKNNDLQSLTDMFVCFFVQALDIVSSIDHPIFQGFSLKPKVFGVGNTPSTR